MCWKAGGEQAWLLQEGRGKHKLTVELVPHRRGCGAMGPASLLVPILPLLLFFSSLLLIPGSASTQGKPMAACHAIACSEPLSASSWVLG